MIFTVIQDTPFHYFEENSNSLEKYIRSIHGPIIRLNGESSLNIQRYNYHLRQTKVLSKFLSSVY